MKAREVVFLVGAVDRIIRQAEADEHAVDAEYVLELPDDWASSRRKPMSTGSRPNPASARRRPGNEGVCLIDLEGRAAALLAENSTLQSFGIRSFTNFRNAFRILAGFCLPTSRKLTFADAFEAGLSWCRHRL